MSWELSKGSPERTRGTGAENRPTRSGDLSLSCPVPGHRSLQPLLGKGQDLESKDKARGGFELGRSHSSRLSVQPVPWKTSCYRESEPNGRQPRPSRVWHWSQAVRLGAAATVRGISAAPLASPPPGLYLGHTAAGPPLASQLPWSQRSAAGRETH